MRTSSIYPVVEHRLLFPRSSPLMEKWGCIHLSTLVKLSGVIRFTPLILKTNFEAGKVHHRKKQFFSHNARFLARNCILNYREPLSTVYLNSEKSIHPNLWSILMEREDDIQLIHRILSGDDAAFRVLVQKHQKSIHALAWRKIGDFHIAEEITQDTFLKSSLLERILTALK